MQATEVRQSCDFFIFILIFTFFIFHYFANSFSKVNFFRTFFFHFYYSHKLCHKLWLIRCNGWKIGLPKTSCRVQVLYIFEIYKSRGSFWYQNQLDWSRSSLAEMYIKYQNSTRILQPTGSRRILQSIETILVPDCSLGFVLQDPIHKTL